MDSDDKEDGRIVAKLLPLLTDINFGDEVSTREMAKQALQLSLLALAQGSKKKTRVGKLLSLVDLVQKK